ncbi:hypothetical protein DJICPGNB_05290 [Escherichia coli]|nr:hypothetical protein DJICPGNB_05290 [Escherichia coli]
MMALKKVCYYGKYRQRRFSVCAPERWRLDRSRSVAGRKLLDLTSHITTSGTVISGNTRITGTSVLWGEVYATDNVWIDNSEISQGAYICDSVTIRDIRLQTIEDIQSL